MKIIPRANNHILIELESGAVLDVNDGSSRSGGSMLLVRLEDNFKQAKNNNHIRVYLSTITSDPFSAKLHVDEVPEENKIARFIKEDKL